MINSARVQTIFNLTKKICNRALQGTSPVAWRNVHLIGNFDFTAGSSEVDIEALAARYQDEEFWKQSMTETEEDGPQ